MKDIRENISEMVDQTYALSFACVKNARPYQVWLHYAGDMRTFVVYSRRDRVHSEIVRDNKHVSVAILPMQSPGAPVRAVSATGIIRELVNDDEILRAHEIYTNKFIQHDPKELLRQATSKKEDEHAYWEIKIEKHIVFDMFHYPDNPRQEYVCQ